MAKRQQTRRQRYLFPEVDGNIGDSQRHQKADERPVRTERWKLHHSTSRDDRARGICLSLVWLERKPQVSGREVGRSTCVSSEKGRWKWGSGRSRCAPVAAALHNASMLLSGGEGQRKFHTGASSPQIIIKGVGKTQGDIKQRRIRARNRPTVSPAYI